MHHLAFCKLSLICQYFFGPSLLITCTSITFNQFNQPTHSSNSWRVREEETLNMGLAVTWNEVLGVEEVFIGFTMFFYLHSTHAFYWITLFKLSIYFVLYSLSTDRNAELFLFHCKEKRSSKDKCRLTQFKGKLDKIQLLRFLQSQMLPKYVSISKFSASRSSTRKTR